MVYSSYVNTAIVLFLLLAQKKSMERSFFTCPGKILDMPIHVCIPKMLANKYNRFYNAVTPKSRLRNVTYRPNCVEKFWTNIEVRRHRTQSILIFFNSWEYLIDLRILKNWTKFETFFEKYIGLSIILVLKPKKNK